MSKKNRTNFNDNTQPEGEDTMSSSLPKESTVIPPTSAVVNDVVDKPSSATVMSQQVKPVDVAPKTTSNVAKLETLLKKFETAADNDKMTGKMTSILVMIDLCEYLNRTNDPQVFETFHKYFIHNKETYMHFETALGGIHTIQNCNVKTRVSATYEVFTELARVRALRKGVYKFTPGAMLAMRISNDLVRWVIEKSRNRG